MVYEAVLKAGIPPRGKKVDDLVSQLDAMATKAGVKLYKRVDMRTQALTQALEHTVDPQTKEYNVHAALELLKKNYGVAKPAAGKEKGKAQKKPTPVK